MIYFPWQYGILVFESLICNFSFLFFFLKQLSKGLL